MFVVERDNDVVEINHGAMIDKRAENVVHHGLKSSGCVARAKVESREHLGVFEVDVAFVNTRSTHTRRVPSFFGASRMGEDQGDSDSSITPDLRPSSTKVLMACCSMGECGRPRMRTGCASPVSIRCTQRRKGRYQIWTASNASSKAFLESRRREVRRWKSQSCRRSRRRYQMLVPAPEAHRCPVQGQASPAMLVNRNREERKGYERALERLGCGRSSESSATCVRGGDRSGIQSRLQEAPTTSRGTRSGKISAPQAAAMRRLMYVSAAAVSMMVSTAIGELGRPQSFGFDVVQADDVERKRFGVGGPASFQKLVNFCSANGGARTRIGLCGVAGANGLRVTEVKHRLTRSPRTKVGVTLRVGRIEAASIRCAAVLGPMSDLVAVKATDCGHIDAAHRCGLGRTRCARARIEAVKVHRRWNAGRDGGSGRGREWGADNGRRARAPRLAVLELAVVAMMRVRNALVTLPEARGIVNLGHSRWFGLRDVEYEVGRKWTRKVELSVAESHLRSVELHLETLEPEDIVGCVLAVWK
ncbi:hypothetical protein C8R43DRAFT_677147 [Mycena crocata]|nr:hypothetical protein C8R43DRAFT_677147 [Mycena crocata]